MLLNLSLLIFLIVPSLGAKTDGNQNGFVRRRQLNTGGGVKTRAVQIGPRPYTLVDKMKPSALKDKLEACVNTKDMFTTSDFSIGHRGACMFYPEHTEASWKAASRMGAGILECDVTFTKDLQLVCRHSQCDLHTTTDVVTRPELNAKCTTPFAPGVTPKCCTTDFTLAEIQTLCAKMDSSNGADVETPEEYAFGGTAAWRTDLNQVACPRVPTHAESIDIILELNGKFTPELKEPSVEMPYTADDGTVFSQSDFAQKLIDEYVTAGVPPQDVWQQSAVREDIEYWLANTDYNQAVALDFDYDRPIGGAEDEAWLQDYKDMGCMYVAPPMWKLVEANPDAGKAGEPDFVPSGFAKLAKEKGMQIITWTLDRTGPNLGDPEVSNWYWQTTQGKGPSLTEGSRLDLLHVLATDVGIVGMFDDWAGVTTFYANCMDMKLR